MKTKSKSLRCGMRSFGLILFQLFLYLRSGCVCQITPPEDIHPQPNSISETGTQFQYARNFAITGKMYDSVSGAGGFDIVRIVGYPGSNNVSYFAVTANVNYYTLYDVNNPSNPRFFGKIFTQDPTYAQDVKTMYYADTLTRIYITEHKDGLLTNLIGVDLTTSNLEQIRTAAQNGVLYSAFKDSVKFFDRLFNPWKVEMIYKADNILFLATNIDTLYYYNLNP